MPALLRRYRSEGLAALLLLGATLAAFGRVLDNGFVNLDDPAYVTNNPDVQAGLTRDGVFWAFTETRHSSFWHPLTWISLELDDSLFGLRAWGFHLTSLLLHAANVLLLFAALRWMTGAVWRSAAVAALFALHPLHVESVAWVSERKDVLSTFFWMLTTLAYLWFLERPQRDRYILLLLAFTLGLLAKPMLVTLPCTLLLLDWWPLGRLRRADPGPEPSGRPAVPLSRLVLEKLPLFALAAASSVVSTVFMSRRVLQPLERFSLHARLTNVVVNYVVYLRKTVWPDDLAAYYPLPREAHPLPQVLAAGFVLALVTAFCLVQARRRPYLLVGWLWYLGTLVPVIGLLQVGQHTHDDRYTYVPLIGIFLAAVWYVADVTPAAWRRPVLVPAVLLVLLLCAAATWRQVGVWHDSVALWENTLAVTEDNYLAHNDLGRALEDAGRVEEAFEQFRAALRLRPDDPEAQLRMGQAYLRHGRPGAALACYRKAAELAPQDARYRYLEAQVLRQLGDAEAAARAEAEGDRLPPTDR